MPCAVSAAARASRAEEGDRKEARSPEEEINCPPFPTCMRRGHMSSLGSPGGCPQ